MHTSTPPLTNNPASDYRGQPTPSHVIGPPAGIPLRPEPSLGCPNPQGGSSSSLPNAPAPVWDARWSAERQLAISSIKSNTLAKKFNGRDAGFYRRWKADLEREVQGLQYTAGDWLGLLDFRTTGVAKDMVSRALELELEDSDKALNDLWQTLDRRFRSHPQAAMKLLEELKSFELVSAKRPDKLWEYALACQQAEKLMDTAYGQQLRILDFPDAQRLVTERLDEDLWNSWMKKAIKVAAPGDPILFKHFSEWIFTIAETYSNPNFTRNTVYNNSKEKDRLNSGKSSSAFDRSKNLNSRVSPPRNLNSGWRFNTNTDSSASFFATSASSLPNTSSGRTYSVHKIDTEISPLCDWCVDKNLEAPNHYLTECAGFLDSNDEDRYGFVWRKGLCFGCLGSGHLCRNCNRQPKTCSNCKRRHNELIPCGA